MAKEKILVAVAWPYVNGDLHVGHAAGYLLPSDIFARFSRLTGKDVLMVSGSDCFGTPTTVEADKRHTTPEKIVEEYHAHDVELFDKMGMSYDLYTKTTTENHQKITQDFLLALWKKGYTSLQTQPQYYDESNNKFLPDRYVEGICPYCGFDGARSDQCDNCGKLLDQNLKEPRSKVSGQPVILKDTQHLYIDWDKLEPQIIEYVEKYSPFWREWVTREAKTWLSNGLKSRAVTRDIDWGVEIPEEIRKTMTDGDSKRIYVWFDAVIGYFSASVEWSNIHNKPWQPWWKEEAKHYYFMGKDNLVFHTIFWPGQLMGYDETLNLPTFPMINQFLNLGGQKFSKSRGVSIDTSKFIDAFGADALRFYLTSVMPENHDSNFTWEDFLQKNNDLLVGQIGNYLNRVLSIYKNTTPKSSAIDDQVITEATKTLKSVKQHLTNCEFKLYIEDILNFAQFANTYVNEVKVWELKKQDTEKFEQLYPTFISMALFLALIIQPVTPFATEKFFANVGLDKVQNFPETLELKEYLSTVTQQLKITEVKLLFTKYTEEEVDAFTQAK